MEGNRLACPYHRCRVKILEELFVWTGWVLSVDNSSNSHWTTLNTMTILYPDRQS
jgi:hypothetical protein